jgi:hypothetical protein
MIDYVIRGNFGTLVNERAPSADHGQRPGQAVRAGAVDYIM